VIQPKSNRTNVFLSTEYDLTDKVSAFVDASLYRAESLTFREPDGITQSTDGFIIVPVTNPYNPFGNRFWSTTGAPNADGTPRLTGTPSAVSITNKRLTDLTHRNASVDDYIYRGVAGLRGKLFRDVVLGGRVALHYGPRHRRRAGTRPEEPPDRRHQPKRSGQGVQSLHPLVCRAKRHARRHRPLHESRQCDFDVSLELCRQRTHQAWQR